MAQENVEILSESWDLWVHGDAEGMFERFDPEIVWDLTHFREWPDRTYRGIEGVRRFLREWLEVWDAYEVGIDETVAAPDGRVVVLAWQRGKGRHSGLPMEMEWAQIVTVRDGKVMRVENYASRDEALEAAGLPE